MATIHKTPSFTADTTQRTRHYGSPLPPGPGCDARSPLPPGPGCDTGSPLPPGPGCDSGSPLPPDPL